jgi:hypothetical protein
LFTPKNNRSNLKNSFGTYNTNGDELAFKSRGNQAFSAISNSMVQNDLNNSTKLESSPDIGKKKKIVKRKKEVQGVENQTFSLSQSNLAKKK